MTELHGWTLVTPSLRTNSFVRLGPLTREPRRNWPWVLPDDQNRIISKEKTVTTTPVSTVAPTTTETVDEVKRRYLTDSGFRGELVADPVKALRYE